MRGLGCLDCRWVAARLPLLAGGELSVAERRKVERHMIACADCRRHRESLAGALGVLHAAAVRSRPGADADAPSIWPSLARQIREARHEPRPSPLALTLPDAGSWLEGLSALFRPRPAWALGAALGLAGLAAVVADVWVRGPVVSTRPAVAPSPSPASWPLDPPPPTFAGAPTSLPLLPPAVVPADPGARVVASEPASPAPDRPAVPRNDYGYDLDHGTPMGPDARGVKASY